MCRKRTTAGHNGSLAATPLLLPSPWHLSHLCYVTSPPSCSRLLCLLCPCLPPFCLGFLKPSHFGSCSWPSSSCPRFCRGFGWRTSASCHCGPCFGTGLCLVDPSCCDSAASARFCFGTASYCDSGISSPSRGSWAPEMCTKEGAGPSHKTLLPLEAEEDCYSGPRSCTTPENWGQPSLTPSGLRAVGDAEGCVFENCAMLRGGARSLYAGRTSPLHLRCTRLLQKLQQLNHHVSLCICPHCTMSHCRHALRRCKHAALGDLLFLALGDLLLRRVHSAAWGHARSTLSATAGFISFIWNNAQKLSVPART